MKIVSWKLTSWNHLSAREHRHLVAIVVMKINKRLRQMNHCSYHISLLFIHVLVSIGRGTRSDSAKQCVLSWSHPIERT
jgi:hypothetical protein